MDRPSINLYSNWRLMRLQSELNEKETALGVEQPAPSTAQERVVKIFDNRFLPRFIVKKKLLSIFKVISPFYPFMSHASP